MASQILVEKNVMVAMRDGVALATDVYRPARRRVAARDRAAHPV